ncbi:unnamed protein product, partial [Rotaria magnacalcarata]
VNSLRDYCGVTAGNPHPSDYAFQQQQLHHLQNSPGPISYMRPNQITTIIEEDEANGEPTTMINGMDRTPYVGHTLSSVPA